MMLKIVLEPSWADLGSFWVPSWDRLGLKIVLSPKAGLVFLKNDVFEKVRCQEATLADLGSIWGPKRLQNGRRGGSKKELS